jgi:uncharacterized protein (DUF1684 family)
MRYTPTMVPRCSPSRSAPLLREIRPYALLAAILAILTSTAAPGVSGTRAEASAGDAEATAAMLSPPAGYADSIAAMRARRVERLRSPDGWLAVAGLYFLQPGSNAFGSDPGNPVALPDGVGPAHAGVFVLDEGPQGPRVTVKVAPGAKVLLDGKPVTERVLAADDTGAPDRLSVGRVKLWVIRRGDLTAIRMRDPESPILRDFTGVNFYDVDLAYRVVGTLEPYSSPRKMAITDIIGVTDSVECPGPVAFELEGKHVRLYPMVEDPDSPRDLFFVFGDATSGLETYGGGRFLSAELGPGDRVVLDFNRAYNPPCAFNPYTTCPLPPRGNELLVPVRAGEKAYAGRH